MRKRPDRRDRLRGLKWLMLGRLVLISVLLGVSPFVMGLSSTPFFYLIAFIYCVTVVYSLLLTTSLGVRIQAYAQFLMDSVIITVLLSFTGGIDSNFILIYVLTIMFSSVLIGGQAGLVLAVSCSGMYTMLGIAQCIGMMTPSISTPFSISRDPLYVSFLVLARATIFCILGYFIDYLVNSMNRNRLELEELRKLNESILSQMKSGLITTDAAGRTIFANAAAEEILGYSRAEMLGKAWQLFLGHPVREVNERWLAEEARAFTRCEINVRRKDGSEIPVGFTVSTLMDSGGAVFGLLIFFRDLTQVHRMEERMRRADRMSAAGAVLASVAHEVRTPLAAIRGAVEVLGEKMAVGEGERKLMKVIIKESDRLNRIVSDFVRSSEAGWESRTREDLCRILDEVVSLVSQGRKLPDGMTINREDGDGPVYARVDAYQIKQVMVNILNNALDALQGKGTVSISVERARSQVKGRPQARVRIIDTGEGMNTERMAHLFEPFYSTKESGSGMGLFIAERIVRSHGGEMEAESREGGGSMFTITLPCEENPHAR